MSKFVVAVPFRSVCDDQARILAKHDSLRRYLVWNRRGTEGISEDLTRKNPALGLAAYVGARTLPPYYAEAFRFSLYPLYDRWAKSHLKPGDNIISSYAYANECFRWVRKHGGKTFLDGGNSHPDNFWEILEEEHRRWKCPYPPVPRFYIDRARRMMDDVDYVLSPSHFVTDSFLSRGFRQQQIISVVYPQDMSVFKPSGELRPKDRPFTIINTGSLSLRKGTPYLLEAFRLIRKEIPDARLLLTDAVSDSIKPVLTKYSDLGIEWSPYLSPEKLADRLRSADVFILPSLEEGLVRTALEAMACGLPVILTPNTGTAQYVREGVNGSVVPIRDPEAIASEALHWWARISEGDRLDSTAFEKFLSMEKLEECFERVIEAAV
jgi:glycosyltransferase involved in cell wall biosynthesis